MNLRARYWSLIIGLVAGVLALAAAASVALVPGLVAAQASVGSAQGAGRPPVQVRHPDVVAHAVKSDTSPPLRDIPPLRYGMAKSDDNDNPLLPRTASGS